MIQFQKKKSFVISNLRDLDKSTSSLLIPEHKVRENGNSLPVYFYSLLRRFRILTLSGMIFPPSKIKTEYQSEGLNLRKVNFRVSNAAWVEIGELSVAFGKSRCALFVYLLELDLAGFGQALSEFSMDLGVPMPENLELKAFLVFQYVLQDFTRSYHVKV